MYLVCVMEIVLLVMLVYIMIVIMSLKGESSKSMVSSYECGFSPLISSRIGFSYRFFLISILFLIFDVEIALMTPLPYEMVMVDIMWGVLFFLMILLGGLVYEYYNGVLSWVD